MLCGGGARGNEAGVRKDSNLQTPDNRPPSARKPGKVRRTDNTPPTSRGRLLDSDPQRAGERTGPQAARCHPNTRGRRGGASGRTVRHRPAARASVDDGYPCGTGWLTGFEPATSCSTGRRSSRLSYSHHGLPMQLSTYTPSHGGFAGAGGLEPPACRASTCRSTC